jgi:hypothetical protein
MSSSVSVFKTKTTTEQPVNIMGVGQLGAKGKGGVPVEEAAKVMSELQEKDERGAVVRDDDGNPTPLTGKALETAAKDYAERQNLRVVSVKEEDVPDLKVEGGALPEPEPLADVSRRLGGYEEEAVEESQETGLPQPSATTESADDETPEAN